MPTYEYKCDACGQAFEKFQSIKADPVKVCPNCGQESVRRLISMGGGLIFKGSGFYITDYRDKGYSESAKADAPAAPAGDAGKGGDAAKSGDEKPATTESAPAAKAAEYKPAEPKPAPKSEPKPSGGKPE